MDTNRIWLTREIEIIEYRATLRTQICDGAAAAVAMVGRTSRADDANAGRRTSAEAASNERANNLVESMIPIEWIGAYGGASGR